MSMSRCRCRIHTCMSAMLTHDCTGVNTFDLITSHPIPSHPFHLFPSLPITSIRTIHAHVPQLPLQLPLPGIMQHKNLFSKKVARAMAVEVPVQMQMQRQMQISSDRSKKRSGSRNGNGHDATRSVSVSEKETEKEKETETETGTETGTIETVYLRCFIEITMTNSATGAEARVVAWLENTHRVATRVSLYIYVYSYI